MKKSTKTILRMILFLCLGGLFGYTVTSVIKSSDRSDSIIQVLKNNYDCKEINQIIYAKGIQFGKNGFSTERGEYELVNCKFTSVEKESKRIQNLLQAKVKGFQKVDLLELEFVNDDQSETITFKEGVIQ